MNSFECILKVKLKTDECQALAAACVAVTASTGKLTNRSDLVRAWIGGGCNIPVKLNPLPEDFSGTPDRIVEDMPECPPPLTSKEFCSTLQELRDKIEMISAANSSLIKEMINSGGDEKSEAAPTYYVPPGRIIGTHKETGESP